MDQSPLARLWNIIKPPRAVSRTDEPKGLNPAQKRLVYGAVGIVLVGALGWQIFTYVTTAPQRADKVFREGMAMMTPGHYPEAIKLFDKATEIYPALAAAYLERGNAQNVLGQTDAALADYDKAIDIGNLAAAYTARGRIYLSKGDKKRAEDDFTKSIGVEPSSDSYYQRAQLRDSMGDHQKAIEDYDQAIHIQPEAPFIYRARSMARKAAGDEEGALQDLISAREILRRPTR
jgi:tetratricopeptide (TPR) repeat protein